MLESSTITAIISPDTPPVLSRMAARGLLRAVKQARGCARALTLQGRKILARIRRSLDELYGEVRPQRRKKRRSLTAVELTRMFIEFRRRLTMNIATKQP
jgi:hypothetical protein